MMVHGFVDAVHVKKEKEKARQLRKTGWWKQKLAEGVCHYCQNSFVKEHLTMDHKVPISRGGRSTKGNVVVCCKDCNSEKKYLTPAEMILRDHEAQDLSHLFNFHVQCRCNASLFAGIKRVVDGLFKGC